jgi:glucose/arabinose dehydrogenase
VSAAGPGSRGRRPAASALGLLAAFAIALAAPAAAQAGKTSSGAQLKPIGKFDFPTYVTQAPGEPQTLYVVEQSGRIVAVRKGKTFARPFLDISNRVRFGAGETESVEAGMLSLAFDPNYAKNGRFYVFYTGPGGDNFLDEYRRDSRKVLQADRSSRQLVLRVVHPWGDAHNGGQLQFGPDGMLWLSTGDGGCCGDAYDQARNQTSVLGKLLRIDPLAKRPGYIAPPDNPLVGSAGNPAIYAWGLRNPWRFSFDRTTNNIFVADVGDSGNGNEEISMATLPGVRGANFGWPQYEGFRLADPNRGALPKPLVPVHSYLQEPNACAVTGGYVVRDRRLPKLNGRYLYSDFCTGRLRSFAPPAVDPASPAAPGLATDDRDEGLFVRFPTSFGQGLNGRIYVVSQLGTVYRLAPKGKRKQPVPNRR